ncbi:hypothetical protein ACHAWO_007604 [Cyclotella atomus]|uniref:HSF-type DNA-binding domain-containing protein n=1 Tax=Cyclotella atomus TaxID=382360 RepID=A0ABD3P6Y7_9STRA
MSSVEESNAPEQEEQAQANNEAYQDDASAAAVVEAANNEETQQQQRAIVSSSENSVASNSTSAITAAASEQQPEPAAVAEQQPEAKAKPNPSNEANAIMLQMAAPPHYPVAEFLFQLTKMLTDDNKRFVEWMHASIVVHDPPGLEKEILPKYFRHSNYSSFQRQMNYFGFRKIAGKGKMAACSYVNENATEDISSLLYIKRKKTGVSGTAARLLAQANKIHRSRGGGLDVATTAAAQQQAQNVNNMLLMQSQMMMQNQGMQNAAAAAMMGMNPMALMQQQNVLGGMNGLNALQMNGLNMGGMNGLPPNMLPQIPANDTARLREQQNILSQLQQAHASAASSGAKNNFVFQSGAVTAPILTNDQGNLYSAGNGQWSMANPANPQALLMQQAAAMGGLGAFPQGMNGLGSATTAAGVANTNDKGLESAANFRSFLNQQISLFSGNQTSSSSAPAAQGNAVMTSSQGQAMPPQGLSYEQFFQLNGN